jgi:adenosine deaminase
VVHAGETGPAESVREAVGELGACRIGHGFAAAADAGLMSWLQEREIALDVCLTSNRRTGALPAARPHPLPRLLAAGLTVTLGSDDPALFRTSLSAEYVRAGACGVSRAQLARMAAAAATASLLPEDRRRRLHRRLAAAWG